MTGYISIDTLAWIIRIALALLISLAFGIIVGRAIDSVNEED